MKSISMYTYISEYTASAHLCCIKFHAEMTEKSPIKNNNFPFLWFPSQGACYKTLFGFLALLAFYVGKF